jgi:hypothetical protein
MSLSQFHADTLEGQADFDMANLRPSKTKLPFVVWVAVWRALRVSQKGGARHDVRVKVAQSPKVIPSQMGTYSVRPFAFVGGQRLTASDEKLLEDWVSKNLGVLIAWWDGDIEYTDEMLEKIAPL